MKQFHVYYNDESVGFESFDVIDDALAFINARIGGSKAPTPENYTLIVGERVPLEAIQRITRVGVQSDFKPSSVAVDMRANVGAGV